MLVEGSRNGRSDYPVVWRAGDGSLSTGRLALGEDALRLRGAAMDLRIPFEQLTSVEIGRGPDERINGHKTVVLSLAGHDRVSVAAVGGFGLLTELTDLVAELRAQRARQERVAVVVPIRREKADEARRLVAEGPPFDPEQLGLERHHVFVSDREAVFVFEGEGVAAALHGLARDAAALKTAPRWRGVVAGKPRVAVERFGWTQPRSSISQ